MRGRGHVNMDAEILRRALEGQTVWIAYPDERARRRQFTRMVDLLERAGLQDVLPIARLTAYERIEFEGLGQIILVNMQNGPQTLRGLNLVGVNWNEDRRSGLAPFVTDSRTRRFDELRKAGKTLGEINTILEQEGFSEVMGGPGLLPCPTPNHVIVRQAKTVRADLKHLKPWYHDDQTDPSNP